MGSTEVAPELKLERVRFRAWRGDSLRASGEAQVVTIRRDTNRATASNLRAELPGRGPPAILTAPFCEGDVSTQDFTAHGGVVLTHGDERAATARVRYQPGPAGTGIIDGQDRVRGERGGSWQESENGFRYDLQSEELVFNGPVTAHGRVVGGGK